MTSLAALRRGERFPASHREPQPSRRGGTSALCEAGSTPRRASPSRHRRSRPRIRPPAATGRERSNRAAPTRRLAPRSWSRGRRDQQHPPQVPGLCFGPHPQVPLRHQAGGSPERPRHDPAGQRFRRVAETLRFNRANFARGHLPVPPKQNGLEPSGASTRDRRFCREQRRSGALVQDRAPQRAEWLNLVAC